MDVLIQALTFLLYAIGAYVAFMAAIVLIILGLAIAVAFWPTKHRRF